METELVLVECVSQFRMRYMVEVPKGKSDYALDTVVVGQAVEFSQKHLDEVIVSDRVVSEQEALELCRVDNECSWSDDFIKQHYFTPWIESND